MSEADNCCVSSPAGGEEEVDGGLSVASPDKGAEEDSFLKRGEEGAETELCESQGGDGDLPNDGNCLEADNSKASSSGNGNGASNTNYDSSDGSVHYNNCKCEQCELESGGGQSCLEAHLRGFTSDGVGGRSRLFECDVCGMKFSNGANMRRHRMRHTGVKPYECRTCQKRFFRKDHLVEHQTTHSKALPYHCPICNKGFQRQIAMRAHFQNEHVGQNDVIKSCPLCSFKAGTMKGLRVHFINRHGIDLDNPATGSSCGGGGSSSTSTSTSTSTSSNHPHSPSNHCGESSSLSTAALPSEEDPSKSHSELVPPHFLAPHIEISMATSASYVPGNSPPPTYFTSYPITSHFLEPSSAADSPLRNHHHHHHRDHRGERGGSPGSNASPPSDSNSNLPSSSNEKQRAIVGGGGVEEGEGETVVKKEPEEEEKDVEMHHHQHSLLQSTLEQAPDATRCSSSSVSLIKVSPLKSLLRDDLKRGHHHHHHQQQSQQQQQHHQPHHPQRGRHALTECSPLDSITSTNQETYPVPPSAHKRMLQCIYCGIIFPDQTLYFLHKGCHSENNPWKCNICGEQCSNIYDFNSHLLSKTHE